MKCVQTKQVITKCVAILHDIAKCLTLNGKCDVLKVSSYTVYVKGSYINMQDEISRACIYFMTSSFGYTIGLF